MPDEIRMSATVTISIEIELAWGHHDLVGGVHEALSEGRRAETEALERLLAACDKYEIPITFSVVGHLSEEHCDRIHAGPHDSNWFAADPGTDVETDPHFYAPDLVTQTRNAEIDHEIATHTYSHVLCDEVNRDVLQWEFDRVRERFTEAGISPPQSFVAPRHRETPVDFLTDNDIRVLRQPFPGYSQPDGKAQTFISTLLRSHPPSFIHEVDGLMETYCTPHPSLTATHLPVGQRPPHPAYRVVPQRIRQRLHERYLRKAVEQAIKRNEHLHLWTHLYNLANRVQWEPVGRLIKYLGEKQSEGVARIVPMEALPKKRVPDHTLENESSSR